MVIAAMAMGLTLSSKRRWVTSLIWWAVGTAGLAVAAEIEGEGAVARLRQLLREAEVEIPQCHLRVDRQGRRRRRRRELAGRLGREGVPERVE